MLGVIYLITLPKKLTITTLPNESSVFVNSELICKKTPCELSLNRIAPKVIRVKNVYYYERYIDLLPFGINWDAALAENIVLETNYDADLAITKIEICKAENPVARDSLGRDTIPCYRIPPIMPLKAKYSGHCLVNFDVTREGTTKNIGLKSCTDDIFADRSIAAVEQWIYLPALEESLPVLRRNVESKLTFRLTDERGRLIPERNVNAQ